MRVCERWRSGCLSGGFNTSISFVLILYLTPIKPYFTTLTGCQRSALMNDLMMTHRNWMYAMSLCLLGHRNTTRLYGEIQHVLSILCYLEYCHPEEQKRPLEGEGWVAAGPLRGLFLQGHTHAWSEAHRGGSGTQRLYWLCHTSVTSHNTSCRTSTLWLGGCERLLKNLPSP